jgi:hypothetical protein
VQCTKYSENAALDVSKRMPSTRTRSLQPFAVVDGDASSPIACLSADGGFHALPEIGR